MATGAQCRTPVSRAVASSVQDKPSLVGRIASHAALRPDDVAIVDDGTALSYAELESRCNSLAAHLRDCGARRETCVGLMLERSADFIVAALAVLKTGAAYLPLDPATPADRLAFILTDAHAPILLTHHGKAAQLAPGSWRVINLDDLGNGAAGSADVTPDPDSLAYVIYTSGSTGTPKGVEIMHANLANLIEWHLSAFEVTADDHASQLAGLGFDAAGWEIWPYLIVGATVHIADDLTRRSPQALRDWLVAEKITISFVPTVLAEQLVQTQWPRDTALRLLLTGADTLHRRPIMGLPFTLVNNYGPTECTVVATSGVVAATADGGPPPIGRPIANARALILDDALRPVRTGEVGELCLAGALVGRGYRNNPKMTAERFVIYKPDTGPSERIYRTGDLARMLPNGELLFLGRLDEQVKIRGYRVELGEIVACLDRCPGIETSAVVARASDNGPVLVAYVATSPDARLTATDLREFLATRLPDYMVPAQFVSIRTMPMTSNGKLDKSALPSPTAENLLPSRTSRTDDQPSSAAAGGNCLPQVAALVAALVGQPTVAPEENFFMLGGHSLLGVQLVARIKDMFGVKLTLRQLFKAPTVAELATEVTRLVGEKQ